MFHCSSFAAFGSATRDGKLYHGRVLDYMTAVGLQQVATVFVVKQLGKNPFVSVGYAGFTGVVSGMNDRQISLGQMGGRGEGDWDGVPMATLMRRAMEECSTLDDVKKLWTDSPRTCEHYFVWADGKIPGAVGVGATAKEIWFVNPGEAHPRLGPGIADTVAISASPRLEALRSRLIEGHGKFDEATLIRVMDRPVAMKTNLHDVLFVPQDLVLHVAQAQGNTIACERPYVRLDLRELMSRMPE
jgi:hypothetical protein